MQIWTDATQLVVDGAAGPRWRVPLEEGGPPEPYVGDLVGLRPVDRLDATLLRVLARDLVRVTDIAERAGVSVDAVARWRRDHRDEFPDPVVPGLFYWPEVVAAGFGGPRPPGRPHRGQRSYPVRLPVRLDEATQVNLAHLARLRGQPISRLVRDAVTDALAAPDPLPVAATPITGGRFVRTVWLSTAAAAALTDRAHAQGVVGASGDPDPEPLARGVLLALLADHLEPERQR